MRGKQLFLRFLLQGLIMLWSVPAIVHAQNRFVNIAENAGVASGGKSNGVAFGDYNNDGYEDIFVTRSRGVASLLFKNNGDNTFTEVTEETGLRGLTDMAMSLWADFDNDGDQDLFVISFSRGNHLYINHGDETFTNISLKAGVAKASAGVAAAVADVDNDGFLDIYIANFNSENLLYRNNGDMTFTDIIRHADALDRGYAMGVTFCDFDNDGDQDLLLVHDGDAGNVLYQNDGTGKFKDVASAVNIKYAPLGMGVSFGDYNNDGHFDAYFTVLGQNLLYRNEGSGRFWRMELADEFANDPGMGWGLTWLDYDNDGFIDLYVANQSDFSPRMPNVLYHNAGNGSFAVPQNSEGTNSMAPSYGTAYADINNDGQLDLFVCNDRQPDELYLNQGGPANWLQVQLVGTTSNRDAIGAHIKLDIHGKQCYREVNAGGGFVSQNSRRQHIGLGSATQVDTLTIRWPSGLVEKYTDIPTNQKIMVTEGVGMVTSVQQLAGNILPTQLELYANYPNPFNPSTTIRFQVGGQRIQNVQLAVFDLTGRLVKSVLDHALTPGNYSVMWHGDDNNGRKVGSGAYLIRMIADSVVKSRKMIVMK